MKTILTMMLVAMTLSQSAFAQGKKEEKKVKQAVKAFAKSADSRDLEGMDAILAPEFRAALNRQFGGEEVSLMDKSAYMGMLKAGKIGGDKRKVEILSLDIVGNNAAVKARLTGSALRFTTFLTFIRNVEGSWKLVQDFPDIEKL